MTENTYLDYFDNARRVKNYTAEPPKFMPGFYAMHQMACILLNETVPPNGHILVHGAGGGLELESFAKFNRHWTFLGIEPALPMLDEAKKLLGPLNDRVNMHHGLIHDAPDILFDAATSMLTLHVIETDERQKTVSEIVRRLKPGAPFIAVHCSIPKDEKTKWLDRHQNFTIASGTKREVAISGRTMIENTLPILSPKEDEAILTAAGLNNVTQFFAAFTWRGWIGYA